MSYLIDTNVLLRLLQRADPNHAVARSALKTLWTRGECLYFAPQNIAEFWNVCTRPATARGGYGLTVAETDRRVRLLERFYELLPESPAVYEEWRQLVVAHAVSGVQVHDVRLVAAMKVHSIAHILTFNDTDFARYANITAVHPGAV